MNEFERLKIVNRILEYTFDKLTPLPCPKDAQTPSLDNVKMGQGGKENHADNQLQE